MRVGIDLGTTYSLVSRMDAEGRPALVPDCAESDVFHTPSVVHLAQNAAFVGSMAEQLLEQDPTIQVIRFFKRLMGVPEPVCYDDNGAAWYPEGVSALLLKKLAFDVESMASQPMGEAVITVPAHFNDPQRKAVLAAATLADIEVMGLVEEPVAAALHYGVVGGVHDQVLLVYDFGGGTFDATAMSMDARGVYVLAKTGLTELGGKEIDEKVGAMILAQLQEGAGARTADADGRPHPPGAAPHLGGDQDRAVPARPASPSCARRTWGACSWWAAPRWCRWSRTGCAPSSTGPASRCCTTSPARRWPTAPPSTPASWRGPPRSTTSRRSSAACRGTASASVRSTRRPATWG